MRLCSGALWVEPGAGQGLLKGRTRLRVREGQEERAEGESGGLSRKGAHRHAGPFTLWSSLPRAAMRR